ncbi:Na(+)/H(+) exchange regulatory cofactor NHE-RF3 [Dunckerocampus dactyliophorus]|uniref:Na(+)/H(+) exchange regulatory cofactor NHE-RF3 n=1 Tax=Dunckerocampus dactyliophorus TaxID=161453 RepID=UPI0024052E8C|nr:Na(+)/H(+) exchange regulatory cofactor NHE-RF3 [Dunckerocampus dactyliophorus]
MAGYKPKVISLTKMPGQTFGFYLRVEQGEDGHLIRCLDMGSPAELSGMKDGDRILRVNGKFVDGLSHSEVVELVRTSGVTVTFHILDEASYKQAKTQGVNLGEPQHPPAVNGVAQQALKPRLCYLVKSSSGYGFSLRSFKGDQSIFITEVVPGGVADSAGVKLNDRLLEVNGDNIEGSTHEQVVDKIKMAGSSLMFLLVDDETDRYYQSVSLKIAARFATTKCLPYRPRIVHLTKGPGGYGFLLREEPSTEGHVIRDIDRGSPAEMGGLRDMDRLVAVDGQEVNGCTHEQVVDAIRQSGDKCCLLVVDKDTDLMYAQAKVSPMLFWEEKKDSLSPPSYLEATTLLLDKPSTPAQEEEKKKDEDEELKPKLCKMEKAAAGFGFHLNGLLGVYGQYIKEVVKGGVADQAGLEDDDVVVEVNGMNVEKSTHEEVVAMIHSSGSSLELLVATKSVYEQLKAKGVAITRELLQETSRGQVHNQEEEQQTPTKDRTASVSSSSSCNSLDAKL